MVLNLEGRSAEAAELIRLPRRGEAVHVINDGALEGAAILCGLLSQMDTPAQCWISTLGANAATAHLIAERMKSGTISSLMFLGSCYFEEADKTEARNVKTILESAGAKVRFARTHAKVWLLKTRQHAVTCEGSANLRSCRSLEQMTVTNDPALLDFHREWIERIYETEK